VCADVRFRSALMHESSCWARKIVVRGDASRRVTRSLTSSSRYIVGVFGSVVLMPSETLVPGGDKETS